MSPILDFLLSACYVGEKVIATTELKEREILPCISQLLPFLLIVLNCIYNFLRFPTISVRFAFNSLQIVCIDCATTSLRAEIFNHYLWINVFILYAMLFRSEAYIRNKKSVSMHFLLECCIGF